MTTEHSLTAVRDLGGDLKRARILEGALKVFFAYGFNRATMDDIARASDVSRPALYLQFRNKGDIYRAIAECVMTRCVERARAELATGGTLLQRLDRMVENALFATFHEIEASPHGPEIIDMKNSLAADVVGTWREAMETLLAAELDAEAARTGIDLAERELTATSMAQMFFDALEGMKPRVSDPRVHLDALRSIVRLLVAALRP